MLSGGVWNVAAGVRPVGHHRRKDVDDPVLQRVGKSEVEVGFKRLSHRLVVERREGLAGDALNEFGHHDADRERVVAVRCARSPQRSHRREPLGHRVVGHEVLDCESSGESNQAGLV